MRKGYEIFSEVYISIMDMLVITASVVVSGLLYDTVLFPVWWLPIYIAVSMFYFCNITRIGNQFELVWLIAVLLNAAAMLEHGTSLCFIPLIGEPARIFVTWMALRGGRYRGVFREFLMRVTGGNLKRDGGNKG